MPLVPVVNFAREISPGYPNQRIVHLHGTHDNIVPVMMAQRGHDQARQAGFTDYTLQIAAGGHDLSLDIAERANRWLVSNVDQ